MEAICSAGLDLRLHPLQLCNSARCTAPPLLQPAPVSGGCCELVHAPADSGHHHADSHLDPTTPAYTRRPPDSSTVSSARHLLLTRHQVTRQLAGRGGGLYGTASLPTSRGNTTCRSCRQPFQQCKAKKRPLMASIEPSHKADARRDAPGRSALATCHGRPDPRLWQFRGAGEGFSTASPSIISPTLSAPRANTPLPAQLSARCERSV